MKLKKTMALLLVLISFYSVQALSATEAKITFAVKALFNDRALIEINGKQHFLSAGEQSPEGVKLLSSDAHEANIFCHGKEYTLYINQSVYQAVEMKDNKSEFQIPKTIVPGKTVSFRKVEADGMTKYMLKTQYANPTVIKYGQDAVWIVINDKLLRFDVEQEAWGEFDLDHVIGNLFVSDKSVVLETSNSINNKVQSGLFLFDTRTSDLSQQLDLRPRSSQFIGEKLWFVESSKGLGYVVPKKNNKSISYKDALLDKEKGKEKDKDKDRNKDKSKSKSKAKDVSKRANILSASDNDIWYSNYSKFRKDEKKSRLNEICMSRYNGKHRTFNTYTRKEMGLDAKNECSDVVVTADQVWVSHGRKEDGLSVFDTGTKHWRHILKSANGMSIGAVKIMFYNDQLFMLINNQLISLDTKTLHANVVLGDAVISRSWRSIFYAANDHVWLVGNEKSIKDASKYNLTLYKIPVNLTKN
ncbi:MAG: hypothetical protein OEY06_00880 [Gammaproteobacteria bacterium]|nr:hypothetical protein [Gammaproteobacteria bacterium]